MKQGVRQTNLIRYLINSMNNQLINYNNKVVTTFVFTRLSNIDNQAKRDSSRKPMKLQRKERKTQSFIN